MLKSYLKNNSWFRRVFRHPLRWRADWLNRDSRTFVLRYRACVHGGAILLRPANIDGEFELDAKSDLAMRVIKDGVYEPEMTGLLADYSNLEGVAVNVGANIGFLAVHLAKTFRRLEKVIAIEPNPEAFALLKRNVERAGLQSQIELHQLCVGTEEGEVELMSIPGRPEYSSVRGIVHLSATGTDAVAFRVPCRPLDGLVGASCPVSLILADTEGAEHLVFSSGGRILRDHRPLLIFECSDRLLRKFGSSSAELAGYLTGLGYVLKDADCPQLSLQHPFEGEVIGFPKNRV